MTLPCTPFTPTRRDKWARLLETWTAYGIASLAGPLLPLEWILNRGLAKAEQMGHGFFVPTGLILSRLGGGLFAEIPTAAIELRLSDWIRMGWSRLHIDMRFLGCGDWSGISSPVRESPVAREAKELFEHGLDYRRTPAYAGYLERIKSGKPVRRNKVLLASPELVDAYFERFADLFRSIQEHGLLRKGANAPRGSLSGGSSIRPWRTELGEKEIGLAIGREGEVYRLPGGQHRTAVALAIGLEKLPIQVRLVHAEWVRKMVKDFGGPTSALILKGFDRVVKGDCEHTAGSSYPDGSSYRFAVDL